jgi:hypothetical protein
MTRTDNVICCFCGEGLLIAEATTLVVSPPQEPDEAQTLFGHAECLSTRVHASVPLHPSLLPEVAERSDAWGLVRRMTEQYLALKLTRNEAIVLFEWLHRFNTAEADHGFEDQAEQRVLWDMEATLESTLTEPFDPDYQQILVAARAKVRDGE